MLPGGASPAPVPGEAEIDRGPTARNVVLLRNVRLRGTAEGERRLDALLDTGATYCIVPASVAFALGFDEGNRLGRRAVNVVGGRLEMDLHELEYVRAGTAQVYRVSFCVGDLGPAFRFMLLGLSFVEHFTTTLDFDRRRVLFWAREGLAGRDRRIPR